MAIEEGLFGTTDGEQLFYRFQPGASGKTPLLLLHGHGEHSGRYLKFFSHLEDLQLPVGIFDLRGNGRSSGTRVSIKRFEDYLSDVSSFVHFLSTHFRVQSPIQLFGHSLGGLIALSWALENSGMVSKLILSSPLLGLPRERVIRLLTGALNRITPSLVIRNPVHPPFLTHDPQEVEKYRNDPLIQRKITIRLVNEMLKYTNLFRRGEISLRFPVCVLLAEEDFVVNPQATHDFFSRLRAPRKELEIFTGYYHEIFNEIGQEKVFAKLRDFLAVA